MSKYELMEVDNEKNLPQALAEVWPVIKLAQEELGFSQTPSEMTLGNLQYSGEKPITWLKQCLAQSLQKASALKEAYWNYKKKAREVEELRLKGDPKSIIEADEIESSMADTHHYIKNAYQDIQTYNQAAQNIRDKFNIPEEISPELLDENSKREHIRKAFRQALHDVQNTNTISNGVSEHLEQYGIHPMTAKVQVDAYRESVVALFQEGKMPTMQHMVNWLDTMEEFHINSVYEQARYMGLHR